MKSLFASIAIVLLMIGAVLINCEKIDDKREIGKIDNDIADSLNNKNGELLDLKALREYLDSIYGDDSMEQDDLRDKRMDYRYGKRMDYRYGKRSAMPYRFGKRSQQVPLDYDDLATLLRLRYSQKRMDYRYGRK